VNIVGLYNNNIYLHEYWAYTVNKLPLNKSYLLSNFLTPSDFNKLGGWKLKRYWYLLTVSVLLLLNSFIKKLYSSNIFSTCPHNMVNFGPLGAEIVSLRWGNPSKFERVSRLDFVTAATSLNGSQPNFAQCLAISWAGTLCIHFRGFLPRNEILPGATFTLCPNLAVHILAALLHGTLVLGVRQTLQRWTEGATYIRQGGHHVGHWPTF